MPEPTLRTVQVDGISISVTDQGAEAISKLQRQLADAANANAAAIATKDGEITSLRDAHRSAIEAKDGEIAGLKAGHTKAIEAKDGEIAALNATHKAAIEAKDGEIAALKAKMPDAAALDAAVAQRSAVIDAARKILGDKFDVTGKAEADIRRAAVVKSLGDAAVTDKSDDYVAAAFDTLTAMAAHDGGAGKDPVRDALRQRQTPATDSETPYDKYVAHLADAWRDSSSDKEAA